MAGRRSGVVKKRGGHKKRGLVSLGGRPARQPPLSCLLPFSLLCVHYWPTFEWGLHPCTCKQSIASCRTLLAGGLLRQLARRGLREAAAFVARAAALCSVWWQNARTAWCMCGQGRREL